MIKKKTAAIIVSFNRHCLLLECICAIKKQTYLPQRIIIIDNASSSQTRDLLFENSIIKTRDFNPVSYYESMLTQNQIEIQYCRLARNLGGAGGFHFGLKKAYEAGFDFFWLMDDDTVPSRTALEKLVANPRLEEENCGALGSLVRWTDDSLHKMNASKTLDNLLWLNDFEKTRTVAINSVSFVSLLIKRDVVKNIGLPIKDFFIWLDDAEYSMRMRNHGYMTYLVVDSLVVHKTKENYQARETDINNQNYQKYKYAIRNRIIFNRLTLTPGIRKCFSIIFTAFRLSALIFKKGLKNRVRLIILLSVINGLLKKVVINFPKDNRNEL